MGWLELIPLIRKLLPMLSHVTPLLESVAAGRMAGKADAERATTASAELAHTHSTLQAVLQAHGNQLTDVAEQLQSLQAGQAALTEHALAVEAKLAQLASAVRTAVLVLGVLLTVCVVLLGILLLRRA